MQVQRIRGSTMISGPDIAIVLCLTVALSLPAVAATNIRLGSVPSEYTPTAGPSLPEPVSMVDFRFEINIQTGRTRVVVDYSYPDGAIYGSDGGSGPQPTMAQLPGLQYDPSVNAVIYD